MTSDLKLETSHSGLDPIRTSLDNGVVLIAKQTRKTPAVTLNLAVRGGSICDPADAPGTTNLLARVIDRGTASRSAAEIADEIDSRGISLTITVTRPPLLDRLALPRRGFRAIFALLGDILMAPTIPESSLRRGRWRSSRRSVRHGQPGGSRGLAVDGDVYGEHAPYGRRLKERPGRRGRHARRALATARAAVCAE